MYFFSQKKINLASKICSIFLYLLISYFETNYKKYIYMWRGFNEFVLLFVTTKITEHTPTFYYTDRLRITFWIALTMSVRPSVCPCKFKYAKYMSQMTKYLNEIWYGSFFRSWDESYWNWKNRSMFRPSPHTNVS